MIVIVDYGMGNLRSVQKAMEHLGFDCLISNDPADISAADKIILPGVGAFKLAIKTIKEKGIDVELRKSVVNSKPILGICLGMQLLFDKSYEDGEHEGLGILPGIIKKLPGNVKIPHMGWNTLNIKKYSPLFDGLSGNPYVYFVHSYYLESDENISSTAFYGKEIQVSVQKDNVYAVQFHPEKSGDNGLIILKNFGGLK